jgi:hypothetical protein
MRRIIQRQITTIQITCAEFIWAEDSERDEPPAQETLLELSAHDGTSNTLTPRKKKPASRTGKRFNQTNVSPLASTSK